MANVMEEVQGAVQYLVQAKECLSEQKFLEARKDQVDRLAVLCSGLPSNQHSGMAMRTLREAGAFSPEQLECLAEALGSNVGKSSASLLWQQGKCQDYEHFFRVLPVNLWQQIGADREAEEWEVFSLLADFLGRAGCISPSEFTCRSLTAFMLLRFRQKDLLTMSAKEKHDMYVKYKDALRARLQGLFDSNPARKFWPTVWKLSTPSCLPAEWLQCSGISWESAPPAVQRPKESEIRCVALTIACRDTHKDLQHAGRKVVACGSGGSSGGEVAAVVGLLERLLHGCLPLQQLASNPGGLQRQLTETQGLQAGTLPQAQTPAPRPESLPLLALPPPAAEQTARPPASPQLGTPSLPESKTATSEGCAIVPTTSANDLSLDSAPTSSSQLSSNEFKGNPALASLCAFTKKFETVKDKEASEAEQRNAKPKAKAKAKAKALTAVAKPKATAKAKAAAKAKATAKAKAGNAEAAKEGLRKQQGKKKEDLLALRKQLLAKAGVDDGLVRKFSGGCPKCRKRPLCTLSCWQSRGFNPSKKAWKNLTAGPAGKQ